MTRAETRLERRKWKQQQEGLYADRDFVAHRVAPLVGDPARNCDPLDWTIEIVRTKATNRITLRYTFGRLAVIYGKVYFDASLGGAAHAVLGYLWKHGFGEGSRLGIPEPLSFFDEANLVLMRRAQGTPLSELASAGPLDKALAAVRLAARWLVKFHSTDIPDLPVELPCERIEILKIADALAKASAGYPDRSALLIGMLHDLHAVAPVNSSLPMTPLHGQFRPGHVFIEGNRATVIDIEKICLSDPAKDVARFLHVLKKTCFEQGGDEQRAGQLAEEFTYQYSKLAPSNLNNLDYFRALLALKAFAKLMKSHKVNEEERRAISEKYRAEFELAIHGC